jgi:hypothetical protein
MTLATIGLSKFAKLVSCNHAELIRELAPYETPGGYDFYGALKEAVFDYFASDENEREALAKLKGISGDNERQKSVSNFQTIVAWRKKNKGNPFVPPRAVWRSPNKVFSVKVTPEIGLEVGGKRRILSLYCTLQPSLTPTSAGVARLLAIEALKGEVDATDTIGLFDVPRNRVFQTSPNIAQKVLIASVESIEREFQRLRGAG